MTVEDIKRLVAPLQRRIMLMIGRASIKSADNGTAQVGVLEGEVRDKVDRMQEWGFSSVPEDDSDAVIVFVGGNRDSGVVIASGNRKQRPDLKKGETAIWTKDVLIKIDKDKKIKITGAAEVEFKEGKFKITDASSIELNGDSKRLVTWGELNTALSSFLTSLGLTLASGANSGGPVAFAVPLPSSIDISAAKTTTLKTGG